MRIFVIAVILGSVTACMIPIKREYQPHDGTPVLSSKESVRLTVRGHLDEVRACFESSAVGHGDLNGKVVLDWTIDKDGNVKDPLIKQSLDPKVDACMVSALQGWTFTPPPVGAPKLRVSFPFVFSQSENK